MIKPSQAVTSLRVESELVLVNVVARDKQGKPVTDLKQDDFTLLEDGKPQKVASFDFENLDTAATDRRRGAVTAEQRMARTGSGQGKAASDHQRRRSGIEQQAGDCACSLTLSVDEAG